MYRTEDRAEEGRGNGVSNGGNTRNIPVNTTKVTNMIKAATTSL